MEQEGDKKKLNDDLVVFMRKRSETEEPRYSARLHAYVDLHRKRSRAAAARRRSEHFYQQRISSSRKKTANEQREKTIDNWADMPKTALRSACGIFRRGGEKMQGRKGSLSRSRSEPSDRCSRRRRHRRSRCGRRRRRCSCRRRRRHSSRRRRRRSRSRKRRRSCRRKRRCCCRR
ncbi:protamine-like isoform X2 [Galleria mellonella]|uniref:Protamine-like isoform X2 n=1 Tax=Galleria mellonella TaxID=7137 RepID=A0A6J3CHI6_GALME|nr:protamine-like isoform X2 [Galleria mellonella]